MDQDFQDKNQTMIDQIASLNNLAQKRPSTSPLFEQELILERRKTSKLLSVNVMNPRIMIYIKPWD